ncbi:MAG: hypothetical protein ACTS9Y_09370 [Methylophilus sp.]|uniref:hypothetical protein n=1 Tax=Methylophilus sp. TaxID=29541 RepID=UPI003FA14721
MTNKKFNRIATIVFYVIGMLVVGLMLISWNAADIPPAAEPLSDAVESVSKAEAANPLPINDREPQNFAQPTTQTAPGK